MHEIDNLSTTFSTIPHVSGKQSGWRTRAKLAVRGTPEKVKIGLFKPGTHEVEDLVDCPDHHPAINRALHLLREAPIVPYNEQTLTGELRYVQLTVERSTQKVQLVLVSNGKGRCENLLKGLNKGDWHSIWVNTQEGSTNTIFGPTWDLQMGPRYLEQTLLGKSFYFHPACFMQANLDLFEEILLDIQNWAIAGQHLTEYYAGIGIISSILAEKCQSATLVEINPYAEECFQKSGPPSHLQFFTGPTENYLDQLRDILIVHPPRKGLDRKVLEALKETSLKQILYLSCNVETLKRDLEVLKSFGWKVKQAKGYHLFPNTDHIELLVDLEGVYKV